MQYVHGHKLEVCHIFVQFKFSKALDRITPSKLHTSKAKRSWIFLIGTAVVPIHTYLIGRSQCIFSGSTASVIQETNLGVPQGSVLVNLLFCFYINDLQLHLEFIKFTIVGEKHLPSQIMIGVPLLDIAKLTLRRKWPLVVPIICDAYVQIIQEELEFNDQITIMENRVAEPYRNQVWKMVESYTPENPTETALKMHVKISSL